MQTINWVGVCKRLALHSILCWFVSTKNTWKHASKLYTWTMYLHSSLFWYTHTHIILIHPTATTSSQPLVFVSNTQSDDIPGKYGIVYELSCSQCRRKDFIKSTYLGREQCNWIVVGEIHLYATFFVIVSKVHYSVFLFTRFGLLYFWTVISNCKYSLISCNHENCVAIEDPSSRCSAGMSTVSERKRNK